MGMAAACSFGGNYLGEKLCSLTSEAKYDMVTNAKEATNSLEEFNSCNLETKVHPLNLTMIYFHILD